MSNTVLKRVFAGATALLLTVSLAACGGTKADKVAEKPEATKSLAEAKQESKGEAKEEAKDDMKEKKTEESSSSSEEIHPMLKFMAETMENIDLKSFPGGELYEKIVTKTEAPGTLIIGFQFKNKIPEGFAAAMDAESEKSLRPGAEDVKKNLTDLGVQDVKVTYQYLDVDGSVAWEKTY